MQVNNRYRSSFMAHMNVTPFVDVMLVLLIVFMVAAPLMTAGVSVQLPQTKAQTLNVPGEPLVITINSQGDIFVQKIRVTLSELSEKLKVVADNNPTAPVYLRGDQRLAYGKIMGVMSKIKGCGLSKVALITEEKI